MVNQVLQEGSGYARTIGSGADAHPAPGARKNAARNVPTYRIANSAPPPASPILTSLFKGLGASPATVPIGELTALASGMAPYLKSLGILPADFKVDENAFLLNNALVPGVPFIF